MRVATLLAVLAAPALAELSAVEEAFVKVPTAEYARETLRAYTSEPHMAGTDGDNHMAKFTAEKFIEYGIEARIEPVKGNRLLRKC